MSFCCSARKFRWLCIACAACCTLGCGQTPQLGGNRESLAAADALWTSVTAKRLDLLDQSESRIAELHAAAKVPDDAFEVLAGVIATARAGQWSDARLALKAFVRGQRPAGRPT